MKPLLIEAYKCLLFIILLTCLLTLTGCTIVRYEDDTHSLTIADLRISGSAIDLNAVLEGKGSLSVNREQGSAEGIIEGVAEIVSPAL